MWRKTAPAPALSPSAPRRPISSVRDTPATSGRPRCRRCSATWQRPGHRAGPLFRQVRRGGHGSNAPLGAESISAIIRARTAAINGTAGRIGGHSLRVGSAPRSRRCRRQRCRAATDRRLAFALHARGLHQARGCRPGSGSATAVPCGPVGSACLGPSPNACPVLTSSAHGPSLLVGGRAGRILLQRRSEVIGHRLQVLL